MMSYRCHARLGSIERHVSAASGAEAVEAPAQLKLLTDDQLQQFLGRGYLMLQAEELGPAFHQALFENAKAEYGPDADEGPPGASHGTTVERVPGLTTLIESPTVAGALQSLLGPDYAHGHLGATGCAFHASGGPGGPGQPFHKDTQRGHICGHRTRNVMVMYYPGSAEEDSGPTAIVPSSHILARDGLGLSYGVIDDGPKGAEDRGDWGGLGGRAEILSKIAPELFEHKVVVPASEAGSVCVVHEDVSAQQLSFLCLSLRLHGADCLFSLPFVRWRSSCARRWCTEGRRGMPRTCSGRCSSGPSPDCTSPLRLRGGTTHLLLRLQHPTGRHSWRRRLGRSANQSGAGTKERPRGWRRRRRWRRWIRRRSGA